jgi:hypothetical protein
MVYVPVYNPTIVYGPWWWPAYPPYYYYPRGAVIAGSVIGFGLGVAVGVAWGYAWGGFNWHHHDVVINITRNVYINNRIDRTRYVSHVSSGRDGQGMWRHDPVHRGGVAYRSPPVAQQFGRGPLPGADARRELRGFDRSGAGRVVAQRPDRPVVQQPRVTTSPGRQGVQGLQGPTAFGGVGPGSQTRQSSNRGHESLSSARTGGSAPSGKRISPSSGGPGGSTSRGDGPRK